MVMHIQNPNVGLDMDYINAWAYLDMVHYRFSNHSISREEFLDKINNGIRTYEEYFRYQSPQELEEAIRLANPQALAQLNQITDEYNSLSLEEKSNSYAYDKYKQKCVNVIKGLE